MKKFTYLLIIIISAILQATFLENVRIFSVKPDLLLICAVLASLIFNFSWALTFSASCGFLKDCFSLSAFGINTILFSLWCILIIELAKKITIDYDFIKVMLLFIICIIHNIALGVILIYLGSFIPFGIFFRNCLMSAICTTLLLPLVFQITNPIYSQKA